MAHSITSLLSLEGPPFSIKWVQRRKALHIWPDQTNPVTFKLHTTPTPETFSTDNDSHSHSNCSSDSPMQSHHLGDERSMSMWEGPCRRNPAQCGSNLSSSTVYLYSWQPLVYGWSRSCTLQLVELLGSSAQSVGKYAGRTRILIHTPACSNF